MTAALKRSRSAALALWRSTAVRLALVAFVVYNANLRPISSADTFPTRYLPISLVTEFDVDLDEFPFLVREGFTDPLDPASDLPYYLKRRRGHVISVYPIMPALLVTPVYALPAWLGLTGDPRAPARPGALTRTEVVGTLLGKIAASLATALSVALVYLSLRRLTTPRGALVIALAYAFATSSWSVSAQGLWQSTLSQLMFAGAWLALLKARGVGANPTIPLAAAGACLATAVMCRPTTALAAFVLAGYVLHVHRRLFLRAFVPPAATLAALLVGYNLYWFGSLIGGYETQASRFTLDTFAAALYGLLASPNRGIIVFSPVVVAGIAGLVAAARRRDMLLRYIGAASAVTLLFYGTWDGWDGAFSYSYRFLVDLLPGLALGAAFTWAWIRARNWRIAGMAGLVAISLFLQVVGAFYYPCDWYRSPDRDPAAMARFYDWGDLEVAQCLEQGPVVPDVLRLLNR